MKAIKTRQREILVELLRQAKHDEVLAKQRGDDVERAAQARVVQLLNRTLCGS